MLWEDKERFFKDFDSDFQYVKVHGISEKEYQTIKQWLQE